MQEYFKRKKYPSQVKYEENNPSITFRMKKQEKELIRTMAQRANMSISALVKMALLDLEKDFTKRLNNSFNKGCNAYAIWCYCYRCNKPKFIIPNSKDHKLVIEQMSGYIEHDKCPE